ncbi:MAG: oxidoreductase [Pseudohongiella sp.]|nr:MAG: oxidoreductase [Pseudohongiella sp.]
MAEFKALQVSEDSEGKYSAQVVQRHEDELPEGDTVIQVNYSSLNFKDAMSFSGNKAVTREYPHTPGIDAAGTVVSSADSSLEAGDEVLVIGYDLGMNTSGGFGQRIRVPAEWVVKLPPGLSQKESMILGTAGFTAALCVEKLLLNGTEPGQGKVLVTGASGGVGMIAVALLSKLGFEVAASTGKQAARDLLLRLGAAEIVDRNQLGEENKRPMLKEDWAGAVDVVGGDTLSNVIKSLRYGASVAACGLVQSPNISATVLPFILRGVNLLGVDSVQLPIETKRALWNKLGAEWKLDQLEEICTEIGFGELAASLEQVLSGGANGRFVLNLNS